jgi:hypothetical protein
MKQYKLYLVLIVITVVGSLLATLPIIKEHNGFDVLRFISETRVNPSAQFIGVDLSFAVLAFVPFMYFESKRIKLRYWALPLIGMFLVGASLVFPWFLYRRAKHLDI